MRRSPLSLALLGILTIGGIFAVLIYLTLEGQDRIGILEDDVATMWEEPDPELALPSEWSNMVRQISAVQSDMSTIKQDLGVLEGRVTTLQRATRRLEDAEPAMSDFLVVEKTTESAPDDQQPPGIYAENYILRYSTPGGGTATWTGHAYFSLTNDRLPDALEAGVQRTIDCWSSASVGAPLPQCAR